MSEQSFGAEFFANNRDRLRKLFVGTAPIIITANGLMQRGRDDAYSFRQDRSFWYLTGIDEADIILVIDRDKEYLVLPDRNDFQEVFDGAIDEEYIRRRSGINNLFNSKDGWRKISQRLSKAQTVATLSAPPTYIEHSGMYSNPARAVLISKLKEHNQNIQILDIAKHLAKLRAVKQKVEIDAIQSAIDLTTEALRKVERKLRHKQYNNERQAEIDISSHFLSSHTSGSGHAFAPIIAGGVRGCTLHNVANNANLNLGETVVVDIGAEVDNYSADLTRTFIYGGEPSKRQQQVYTAVLAVQEYAISLLKPGVLLRDYEEDVMHFMGEKLRELGLIKNIDEDSVRKYFPHSTTHFLGLDTHDVGLYGEPIESGMVMTVEPGIYIREEKIGIRIEDDVLITADGCKVLSSKLSKDIV